MERNFNRSRLFALFWSKSFIKKTLKGFVCSLIIKRFNVLTLCSALMTIEQWGFFSVPHLLWHGTSVCNGHLRGPVTLTPITEIWQWSCHYLFLRLRCSVAVMWTSNLPLAWPTSFWADQNGTYSSSLHKMKKSSIFTKFYGKWRGENRFGTNF